MFEPVRRLLSRRSDSAAEGEWSLRGSQHEVDDVLEVVMRLRGDCLFSI
jgi:hypothetical protein